MEVETALDEIRSDCWQFLATEKRIGAHLAYAEALGTFVNELSELRTKVIARADQLIAEADGVRA